VVVAITNNNILHRIMDFEYSQLKGNIVVCKDNDSKDYIAALLLIGKHYEVFLESVSSYLINVGRYNGVWVNKSHFTSIEDYREIKLNEILSI
jgi:hypothetical protein